MKLEKGVSTKINKSEEVYITVSKNTDKRIDFHTDNKNLRFMLYLTDEGWELNTYDKITTDMSDEEVKRVRIENDAGIRRVE